MFLELISETAYLRIPWKPHILLWFRWVSTLTAMRECVCVAVSASDLHTECLWHWDTLPSQICLKHCHNKPLNQSLVWAPHLKHLCFYCCRRCPPEHSTTQSSYQHQAPDTPHAAPLLLLSCTYDPDALQKQVWHKYRLNTMIIIILFNWIII